MREDHYPAPFRLIDLFEKHGGNLVALKEAETRAFAPLMVSETSRNLRRVFRLSELLKGAGAQGHRLEAAARARDRRRHDGRRHRRLVRRVGHGGVAAGSLAEQIKKGIEAQGKLLARKFRTKAERDAAKARLIADPKGELVGRADVVIEAIVEKLEVKQKLFQDLEAKLKPGAVMASNTSSIMIEDIARGLADPGRLIGIHFFNPVAQMPLVEIVRGTGSREEEVKKGAIFVTAIDKFPLVVKSVPGFLVNRVLAPYLMGAFQRLEKGEEKEKIDEAARTVRHADGADRACRCGRPRCLPARRQDPEAGARWHQARGHGQGRQARQEDAARASTSGSTAARRRPRRPTIPPN